MDRVLIFEYLQEAERHIAEGEYRIHHQLRIISELERGGQPLRNSSLKH